MKCYCLLTLHKSLVFYFECLDILQDSIGNPSKKLLPFEFAWIFRFWLWVSQYIIGLNRTFEKKVIGIWICLDPPFLISSILIYYWIQSNIRVKSYRFLNLLRSIILILCVSIYNESQSDIRVKSYCRLNFLRASVFNLEHLDILRDTIEHPSKKEFSFEFASNFHFPFRVPRYITGLNRTSM